MGGGGCWRIDELNGNVGAGQAGSLLQWGGTGGGGHAPPFLLPPAFAVSSPVQPVSLRDALAITPNPHLPSRSLQSNSEIRQENKDSVPVKNTRRWVHAADMTPPRKAAKH